MLYVEVDSKQYTIHFAFFFLNKMAQHIGANYTDYSFYLRLIEWNYDCLKIKFYLVTQKPVKSEARWEVNHLRMYKYSLTKQVDSTKLIEQLKIYAWGKKGAEKR